MCSQVCTKHLDISAMTNLVSEMRIHEDIKTLFKIVHAM